MASKVPTSKSSAPKGAASKASASKAPSRASRAGTVSGARGSSKSATAKGAASKSKSPAPAPEKEDAKKPAVKTADLPTLSLIDEPAPKKRVAPTGKALPRIGENQPAAPAPAEPVEAAEEEVVIVPLLSRSGRPISTPAEATLGVCVCCYW